MRRLLVALAAALMLAGTATPVAPAVAVPAAVAATTVRILVVGDSISDPCNTGSGWCADLSALLATAGITADIRALASPGKRCKWMAERIDAALVQHSPDVMLLNCGTNDDPLESCYGEACTSWAWRYMAEAAHNRGVARIGAAFIGYTDPDHPAVLGIKPRLERNNDLLYGQITRYLVPWPLALANFQVVPSTPPYLPDGVHPTSPLGAATYARIWYDALAARGWVPASAAPPPCGMFGRRAGYPVPSYIPC